MCIRDSSSVVTFNVVRKNSLKNFYFESKLLNAISDRLRTFLCKAVFYLMTKISRGGGGGGDGCDYNINSIK